MLLDQFIQVPGESILHRLEFLDRAVDLDGGSDLDGHLLRAALCGQVIQGRRGGVPRALRFLDLFFPAACEEQD